MTVDKERFGGGLDLPPEAEEMMAMITELTGCSVVLIPADATQRFKDACEIAGIEPHNVFSNIMDGIVAAIEAGVPGVIVQLAPLGEPAPESGPGPTPEPGSEQVNGKIH